MTRRRDQMLSLARAGLRPGEIAQRLGVTASYVYGEFSKARRDGQDVPRFAGSGRTNAGKRGLRVSDETFAALDAIGAAHGMSGREVARAILDRAAAHPRVAGVLLTGGPDG